MSWFGVRDRVARVKTCMVNKDFRHRDRPMEPNRADDTPTTMENRKYSVQHHGDSRNIPSTKISMGTGNFHGEV